MSVESHDSSIFVANKTKRPPFKLCFAKQQETGRSDAYFNKINAQFITPKFYARDLSEVDSEEVENTAKTIERDSNKTPKSVYPWPILSSHTYRSVV